MAPFRREPVADVRDLHKFAGMPPRVAQLSEQRVTASELVRHFGMWQERASRAPVYILHRGRPRFVLATVETIDALCAPHGRGATPPGGDLAVLLDTVSDLVFVTGPDLTITASSVAARTHFSSTVALGARIELVAPPEARAYLAEAIQRVIASGIPDRLDIPSPARPGRLLALSIVPLGQGIALIAQDMTSEHDYRRAVAADHALSAAASAIPGVATVRINQRGYVVDPGASLAALTGLAHEALAMIRFTALIDIAARVAVADTIDAVLTDGRPRVVDAGLLVNRAPALPIRIGLGAIRSGTGIESVAGLLAVGETPTL